MTPRRMDAPTAPLRRLAWRNVWRHRRRTTLLIVVVAYATLTTIVFWGVNDGFFDSILTGQARFLAAPVLIATPAYRDDPDPEHALPTLDFVPALLRAPGVRVASPRLEFPALVRSPYTAEAVQARGVDPALEGRVSAVPGRIGRGRMLARPGEVVLGGDLARRIDSRIGERVVLDTASVAGPQAAGLVVVGLVESGAAAVDQGAVLVHLDEARRLTGVRTATGVALDVPRGREDETARAIQPLLPDGVRAYGLTEQLGSLQEALVANRLEMIPLGLLFSIVAAIAVTSTVLVSVIERTREFGVITALGLSPGRLARMVLLEATIATAIGWAAGLAVGYAITLVLGQVNVIGRLYGSAYGEAFAFLGMSDEVYMASSPWYAVYTSVIIVLAALFVLLAPARRVRRLDPARALRVE